MEVDDALSVSADYFLRQQQTHGQIFADLAGHVISLSGVDYRVLIGVLLLDLFIHAVDQGKDTVVRGVGFTGQFALEAVTDVFLSDFIAAHFHDAFFHHILDIFHICRVRQFMELLFNRLGNSVDLIGVELVNLGNLVVSLGDGVLDLGDLERNFFAVAFDDF